jgi:hypothetical protein
MMLLNEVIMRKNAADEAKQNICAPKAYFHFSAAEPVPVLNLLLRC